MDQGGGGDEAGLDEKLALFQSLTGLEDMALCSRILQAHSWDLDAAVSAAIQQQDGSSPSSPAPAPPPAAAAASAPQSDSPQLRYPPGIPRSPEPLGLAQLAPHNPSGDGADQIHHPPHNPGLVWRIVTLPFNIVRGGLMVATGALGLGVWVAGSVLSYSLGAVGLLGDQNRARIASAAERFLPASSPGALQATQFIQGFQREYGARHPEFAPLSFMEALRRSSEEFKFLFVYLHSPEHVDTPEFCQQTLCSEAVVEFLNQNFVCWGADVRSTEGFQMFNSLKASTFPFSAVVMASSNQRIALLQQVEGMRSAAAYMATLQKVMDEQGPALVALRHEDEERRRNRELREEQDAAYQAALLADQERERKRVEEAERQAREAEELQRQQREKELAAELAAKQRLEKALALGDEPQRGPNATQVIIRFPTGERKERRFNKTCTVQSVYDFVDSLGLFNHEARYSLVSNFPRTVYSADKLGLSLTEAGLHPHASLFVQLESQ